MKCFYLFACLFFACLSEVFAQGDCIGVDPVACQFECLPVTYTGTAPPSATYTWTTTCGTLQNPNQQNPGNLCFVFIGTCTMQLIVEETGQTPDTCTAEVIVFPNPDGIIEGDTTLCSGDCAPLIVHFLTGQPPFAYQVDDGIFTNFYTSSGFVDTIDVCPPFTTTYTLTSITDAFGCTGPGPFNSVTVDVQPGIMGSVNQVGNFLCANPPNQNYQWWDCGFTQLQSISQCYAIPSSGCYCVIVSDAMTGCLDTVCGDYMIPCTLTCAIIAPDSVCFGDTVQFAYFGNASDSALFEWTLDVSFGSPLSIDSTDTVDFAFDGYGCVYAQLIIHDGLCESTCYDTVCTYSQLFYATLYDDIESCDSCVQIPIGLSGVAPYTIMITDGTSVDTIIGIPDDVYQYVVCPPADTSVTYTLLAAFDSASQCPVIFGDDTVVVETYTKPVAVITQIENTLCADPVLGTYAWYDCNYSQLYADSSCLALNQTGCYCLVVTNGICSDTMCGEYVYDPCNLTCDISLVADACLGDSVIFAYTGNAGSGAIFNWMIDLPGFPGSMFTGNDTITLAYSQPGCYQVSLNVFDSGCMSTCSDSICINEPHSDASICCDVADCDTCASMLIILDGTPPWTIFVGDGNAVDTVSGINYSPFLYTVCPPLDSTITYTLLGIQDTINNCPGYITGTNNVTITLHSFPVASIMQMGDTLCASPANMAGYGWYACPAGVYLSTSQCFVPIVSGCYCVDVSNEFDCVDTACTTIILSGTENIHSDELRITPNPSSSFVEINLPNTAQLPVEWTITNAIGQQILSGASELHQFRMNWPGGLATGLYFLQIKSADQKLFSGRLLKE